MSLIVVTQQHCEPSLFEDDWAYASPISSKQRRTTVAAMQQPHTGPADSPFAGLAAAVASPGTPFEWQQSPHPHIVPPPEVRMSQHAKLPSLTDHNIPIDGIRRAVSLAPAEGAMEIEELAAAAVMHELSGSGNVQSNSPDCSPHFVRAFHNRAVEPDSYRWGDGRQGSVVDINGDDIDQYRLLSLDDEDDRDDQRQLVQRAQRLQRMHRRPLATRKPCNSSPYSPPSRQPALRNPVILDALDMEAMDCNQKTPTIPTVTATSRTCSLPQQSRQRKQDCSGEEVSAPCPEQRQPTLRSRKRQRHAIPPKACNCKKSKCLKLYCECYAAGVFCRGCNCQDCHNVLTASTTDIAQRREDGRIAHTDAGGAPIDSSVPPGSKLAASLAAKRKQHAKKADVGCFCKKSRCLKKYCECFLAGGHCDSTCKCEKCLNFPGSQDLIAARAKQAKLSRRGEPSKSASRVVLQNVSVARSNDSASSDSLARVVLSPTSFPNTNGLYESDGAASVFATTTAAKSSTALSMTTEVSILSSAVSTSGNNNAPKTGSSHCASAVDDTKMDKEPCWTNTAWIRTTRRAVQQYRIRAEAAKDRAAKSTDRASAARAAADALMFTRTSVSQECATLSTTEPPGGDRGGRPVHSVDKEQTVNPTNEVAVAMRIAAATIATRTTTVGRPEADEIQALASGTFGAVLKTLDDEAAQAAGGEKASWSHPAARASQRTRPSGDAEAFERAELDRAWCAAGAWRDNPDSEREGSVLSLKEADDHTNATAHACNVAEKLERLAAKDVHAANRTTTFADRAEWRIISPDSDMLLRATYQKHDAHLKRLKKRDGDLLTKDAGLPFHRHIFIKAFQFLPNEDLFGSCLVNRKWTSLALDGALWSFFSASEQKTT